MPKILHIAVENKKPHQAATLARTSDTKKAGVPSP
jgi:hypothetical protein